MKTTKVTARNNFHNTSTDLRCKTQGRSILLSEGQRKRAKKETCGCSGCTCHTVYEYDTNLYDQIDYTY